MESNAPPWRSSARRAASSIPVAAGSTAATSLAGSSRVVLGRCYPSPQERGAEFQARIFDEMKNGGYHVLIPMTDITLRLVARMREALRPLVRVTVPSEHQIELAQDKRHVFGSAQQLGIGFPNTSMLHPSENLADVALAAHYPVVIKPRFSWWPLNGGWVSGNVQYAHNPEELSAKYQESHRLIPEPLIQEKIEGEGRGVFSSGGMESSKQPFAIDASARSPLGRGERLSRKRSFRRGIGEKIVLPDAAIDWEGPAMLEFKVD